MPLNIPVTGQGKLQIGGERVCEAGLQLSLSLDHTHEQRGEGEVHATKMQLE